MRNPRLAVASLLVGARFNSFTFAAFVNGAQVLIGLLFLNVRAATALAEERACGSLDLLLVTPLPARSIVWSKWWAVYWRAPLLAFWPAVVTAAIVYGRGPGSGHLGSWPVAVGPIVALVIALILAYGAASVSLGLALAAWLRRPGNAIAWSVGAYVLVPAGWFLLVTWAGMGTGVSTLLAPANPFYGLLFPLRFSFGSIACTVVWILIYVKVARVLLATTQDVLIASVRQGAPLSWITVCQQPHQLVVTYWQGKMEAGCTCGRWEQEEFLWPGERPSQPMHIVERAFERHVAEADGQEGRPLDELVYVTDWGPSLARARVRAAKPGGSSRLPASTVLLLSRDSSLAASCRLAVGSLAHLRPVVVRGFEEAEACLRDDAVSLVLVHLIHREQTGQVVRLLQALAASKCSVATLVIGEKHLAEQGLALLRWGATDYLARPLDLGRLAYLMDLLTVRARYAARSGASAAGGAVGMRGPSRVELLRRPYPAAVRGGEGSRGGFPDGLDDSPEAAGARVFGRLPPGAEPLAPGIKLAVLAALGAGVALYFAVALR